jgi:hypothetical protein
MVGQRLDGDEIARVHLYDRLQTLTKLAPVHGVIGGGKVIVVGHARLHQCASGILFNPSYDLLTSMGFLLQGQGWRPTDPKRGDSHGREHPRHRWSVCRLLAGARPCRRAATEEERCGSRHDSLRGHALLAGQL